MRLGQHVHWVSLTGSGRILSGTLKCFEHLLSGWALVEMDGHPELPWLPLARSRLSIAKPPAKKTAKGGGDSPPVGGVLLLTHDEVQAA